MFTRSRCLQILVAIALLATIAGLGTTQAKAATSAGANARHRQIHLGVFGKRGRFAALTGQQGDVQQAFVTFNKAALLGRIIKRLGPVPMVALIPGTVHHGATATPKGIATGQNDAFLFRLNAAIARYPGRLFYLRPFPEMNGHWESNCAFNEDGTMRPSYDSTRWSRRAFARIAVIARGGRKSAMNAKLARLRLPPVGRGLPDTTSKLKLVWNPQGYGSPNIPGNSANAYYPGDAYVDVVADDIYGSKRGATWWWADALYRAHPTKEFGFGEWGLWGIDDPAFIQAMSTFVRTHDRLVFLAYYNGRARSIWDIRTKPESAAAYRTYISPLGRSPARHRSR
jgi:hypothetical protein